MIKFKKILFILFFSILFLNKSFSANDGDIYKKIDLFERGHRYEIVKLDDSFPDYLLKNINKFKDFIDS